MSEVKISTRQALALLRVKVGAQVKLGKLERVIRELTREKRVPEHEGYGAWMGPGDLDVVEGELRRMAAGWYQRRNVRGDFDAWVTIEDGVSYLARLPWSRAWDKETAQERVSAPEAVSCWEWPTARLTGVLRRSGEKDGLPVYEWQGVDEISGEEKDELVAQWQTGAMKRAQ